MADLYGLEASGLPPELVAQLGSVQGQKKIAEAMLRSGLSPIQVQSGRISPTQGIAQILSAYLGRKGLDSADSAVKDIASKKQALYEQEMGDYNKARMGTPAQPPTTPVDDEGNPNPMVSATHANPRDLIAKALQANNPMVQRLGQLDFQTAQQDLVREDQQRFRAEDRQAQIQGQIKEAEMRLADSRLSRAERAAQEERMARLVASLRQAPAPTVATIADPNDPTKGIVVDARTNRKIGDSPKLTDAAKQGQKDAKRAEGFGAAIQMAEDLLSGVKRGPDGEIVKGDMPTQSGLGSIADDVANFFGVTLKGATEAKQLEVIAGKLIAAVPRFEGPQSDKDTALYKQMAADAANPKLPASQRLAAVKTMKTLYDKQPSAFESSATKPSAKSSGGWSVEPVQQ